MGFGLATKRKSGAKTFLGAGGTRRVYDLGDGNVLKIAKSAQGKLCNKMEVDLFRVTDGPLKRFLAEIVSFDENYRWIVMKKYNVPFPNSRLYRRKLMKIAESFRTRGIIPSPGVGNYRRPYRPNLRLGRDREIVIIDYGGFRYARET